MKFFATTAHKTFNLDVTENSNGFEVNSGSKSFLVDVKQIDDHRYSFIINNESYIVNIDKKNDVYTTIIRGKQIDVVIDDEKSKAWKEILEEQGGDSSDRTIISPMPGLIVKINVQEGQHIDKGDSLFVLSAMKMENEIKSNSTGLIRKIYVNEGQSVEKSQIIIDIE